jgi:hypothetical protein
MTYKNILTVFNLTDGFPIGHRGDECCIWSDTGDCNYFHNVCDKINDYIGCEAGMWWLYVETIVLHGDHSRLICLINNCLS